MEKVKLIDIQKDIFDEILSLINNDLENSIVIFPNRRPGYFLVDYISKAYDNKPLPAPKLMGMDDFINFVFEKINPQAKTASEYDLIYSLLNDFGDDIQNAIFDIKNKEDKMAFDYFLPVALSILSDFEELKIHRVEPQKMRDFDFIVFNELSISRDDVFRKFSDRFIKFSDIYAKFYQKLEKEKRYTRSMKYSFVSQNIKNYDMSGFKNIVFAGFFALTESEKIIFKNIYNNHPNSYFLYYNTGNIKDYIPFTVEDYSTPQTNIPKLVVRKVSSSFEELSELRKDLISVSHIDNNLFKAGRENVVVINDESIVTSLLNNVLGDFSDFNVSSGFPLKLTPIYSMFMLLFELIESATEVDGKKLYSIEKYFKFLNHPYIKNIKFDSEKAEETRKEIHRIFEKIKKPLNIRISLSDVEGDSEIIKRINDLFIRSFDSIKNVDDFLSKLLNILKYLDKDSTASRHHYWAYFNEVICDIIEEIKNSEISKLVFNEKKSYFDFIKIFFNTKTHPFKGSPIKGLQCIGFLEARNLKFKNVFMLDLNNEILPNIKKKDSVIPDFVRKELNIPDSKTSFDIYSYYFHLLFYGCENFYAYYVDNKEREISPLLEKIKWLYEKEDKDFKETTPVFNINFNKKDLSKIKKTDEIKRLLSSMSYSYSAIENYLKCQLSFYYQYVLGLSENEEIKEDFEKNEIGIILHKVFEKYFSKYIGKTFIDKDKDKEKKTIFGIFEEEIKRKIQDRISLKDYMFKKQILNRLSDFIEFHFKNHRDREIIMCEKNISFDLQYDKEKYVKFNARIDRVDKISKDGKNEFIITDYKTGHIDLNGVEKMNLDKMLSEFRGGKKLNLLQLFIYVYCFAGLKNLKNVEGADISNTTAEFLCLHERDIKVIPEEIITFENENINKVMDFVKNIISEIIDDDYFNPPENDNNCEYCPYKTICDRL
ncbi:MAG: PD-(D/E)XK nuclease family protein [Elusimicrobiota bacterium]